MHDIFLHRIEKKIAQANLIILAVLGEHTHTAFKRFKEKLYKMIRLFSRTEECNDFNIKTPSAPSLYFSTLSIKHLINSHYHK